MLLQDTIPTNGKHLTERTHGIDKILDGGVERMTSVDRTAAGVSARAGGAHVTA